MLLLLFNRQPDMVTSRKHVREAHSRTRTKTNNRHQLLRRKKTISARIYRRWRTDVWVCARVFARVLFLIHCFCGCVALCYSSIIFKKKLQQIASLYTHHICRRKTTIPSNITARAEHWSAAKISKKPGVSHSGWWPCYVWRVIPSLTRAEKKVSFHPTKERHRTEKLCNGPQEIVNVEKSEISVVSATRANAGKSLD